MRLEQRRDVIAQRFEPADVPIAVTVRVAGRDDEHAGGVVGDHDRQPEVVDESLLGEFGESAVGVLRQRVEALPDGFQALVNGLHRATDVAVGNSDLMYGFDVPGCVVVGVPGFGGRDQLRMQGAQRHHQALDRRAGGDQLLRELVHETVVVAQVTAVGKDPVDDLLDAPVGFVVRRLYVHQWRMLATPVSLARGFLLSVETRMIPESTMIAAPASMLTVGTSPQMKYP